MANMLNTTDLPSYLHPLFFGMFLPFLPYVYSSAQIIHIC